MKAYFNSCPSCPNGVIEHEGTISGLIDKCRERWGNGSLIRLQSSGEYLWRKDEDAKWVGCCAEKVYGPKPPSGHQHP